MMRQEPWKPPSYGWKWHVAGGWNSEGWMLLWARAGVQSASAWLSLGSASETSFVAARCVPTWVSWFGASPGSEFAAWLDSRDRVDLEEETETSSGWWCGDL